MITANNERFWGSDDSETLQNAIDEAAKGSRMLTIPRYNARRDAMQWRITRALKLPDNFTLILDNCYMVMETGVYDHMFTNARSYDDTARDLDGEQHDITILGKGNATLDGGEHNHLLEKTSGRYGFPRVWKNTMFFWLNVRNLRGQIRIATANANTRTAVMEASTPNATL